MDTILPPAILKRDVLGRVTLPRAQREALLDVAQAAVGEFERSGMKGQPFAKLVGTNYQTFASWIQKRRRARGDYAKLAVAKSPLCDPMPVKPLRLLEVVLPPPTDMSAQPELPAQSVSLELVLPGGARLLIANSKQAQLAAFLLQSLNATTSPPC